MPIPLGHLNNPVRQSATDLSPPLRSKSKSTLSPNTYALPQEPSTTTTRSKSNLALDQASQALANAARTSSLNISKSTPPAKAKSTKNISSSSMLSTKASTLDIRSSKLNSSSSAQLVDHQPLLRPPSSTRLSSSTQPKLKSPGSLANLFPSTTTTMNAKHTKLEWQLDTGSSGVHCLSMNENGDLVGVGLSDGRVCVYYVTSGQPIHQFRPLKLMQDGLKVPVTTIAWRPNDIPQSSQDQPERRLLNTIVAGYPDGQVVGWHVHGLKDQVWQLPVSGGGGNDDNQILAIDFSPVAAMVATAGSDTIIRVYEDFGNRKLIHELNKTPHPQLTTDPEQATFNLHIGGCHSNRIFSIRFHPKQANILISGGWDSTIQVWDLDVGYSIRSIFQPHIIGDCLDFNTLGTHVLAGSLNKVSMSDFVGGGGNCTQTCIDLYALESGEWTDSISWISTDPLNDELPIQQQQAAKDANCPLYTTRFSKSRKFVIAGGGQSNASVLSSTSSLYQSSQHSMSAKDPGLANQVKVFNFATRRCIACVTNLPGPVYCANLSLDDKRLIFGGAFGSIYCYVLDPLGSVDIV